MESLQSLVEKKEDDLAVLKKLSGWIFNNGATLSCAKCGRTKEKTADEMAEYLRKWPRCCGLPANVKTN